jgi:hypothetical protein
VETKEKLLIDLEKIDAVNRISSPWKEVITRKNWRYRT